MASEAPVAENRCSPPAPRRSDRILLVMVGAVVLPVGLTLLYVFSPTEHTFLPCWFHWATGMLFGRALHCPGCGGTRCMHALLHGDLEQALAYNPLFVILSPWLAYRLLRFGYSLWTGKTAPGPGLSERGTWVLLAVLATYWIIRNIDVFPLNLLAPHSVG